MFASLSLKRSYPEIAISMLPCDKDSIASLATEINQNIENIGARRLHTIMEKLLEEVSFNASDIGPTKVTIHKEFVETNLVDLIKSQDLSKFIL